MNIIKNFFRPTKVTWWMFTMFSVLIGLVLFVFEGRATSIPLILEKIIALKLIVGQCVYPHVPGAKPFCVTSVEGFIPIYLILLIGVYIFASFINYLSMKVSKK